MSTCSWTYICTQQYDGIYRHNRNIKYMIEYRMVALANIKTCYTCIKFTRCDLGSTNPALFSSNEYSISSSTDLAGVIATCNGADVKGFCIGVMAICIGIGNVEGVDGILFSTSIAEIILEGVLNGMLLLVASIFGNMSLWFRFRSPKILVAFDFDESVEEMGEKGFRVMGDSISRPFCKLRECCFTGSPAKSKPLLPEIKI